MTTPLEERLKLEVPLRVELGVGRNWLDVEEVKEPQMNTEEHRLKEKSLA